MTCAVSAAKLTHYADSSAFVKYPLHTVTNGLPATLPRWIEEDSIPGGAPASNQNRRVTYDLACSLAGTVDAFVRRSVAATLFGTPEAAGYMLGTNHVTGAEYATTNVICSQLFFDHVMGWPEQGDGREFCLKSLDYDMACSNVTARGETRTVYYPAPTARLFADKYLLPVQLMLDYYDGYPTPAYYWVLGTVPGLAYGRGPYRTWSYQRPDVTDHVGNHGKSFGGDGVMLGWTSSHAESATYEGAGNDVWTTNANLIVRSWPGFFADIPNLFEPPDVVGTDDPRFMPSRLYDGLVGCWSPFVGWVADPYRNYVDYDAGSEFLDARLLGCRPTSQGIAINDPYPGRRGFELMADTCGVLYTNFPPVTSRRLDWQPYEVCNTLLGLADTVLIGSEAMPTFRYLETVERAEVESEWEGTPSHSGYVYLNFDQESGLWKIDEEEVVDFNLSTRHEASTNFVESTETVDRRSVAFLVPSSPILIDITSTNDVWTFPDSDDIDNLSGFVRYYGLEGEIGTIRANGVPNTDWVVVTPNMPSSPVAMPTWEFFDNGPLPAKLLADAAWTVRGYKHGTALSDYDYTLMSATNSVPCCHPLPVAYLGPAVNLIHLASFRGFTVAEGTLAEDYLEWAAPYHAEFNLACSTQEPRTARDVDSAASMADYGLARRMDEWLVDTYDAKSDMKNLSYLRAAWALDDPRETVGRLVNVAAANGFVRTFSCAYMEPGFVHFKVLQGTDVVVFTTNNPFASPEQITWDVVDIQAGTPEYLRIHFRFGVSRSLDTEEYRRRNSFFANGAVSSVGAVEYDFKTMKRED